MNLPELTRRCKVVIENGGKRIVLIVPGPQPRGEKVRFLRGRSRLKCPMGYVVGWRDDPPRTVADFDAIEILAWLAHHKLITVKATC